MRMSGVDVVRSFDNWEPALQTYRENLGNCARSQDVRQLPIDEIPKNVNVIIGSPPCTEFSYSNKGGNGNYKEGLKDIKKFLEIVSAVRPRFWIMENVPRVANILEEELSNGGELVQFRRLVKVLEVVDMSEFGLPQRRRRCLAGDFPMDILKSYRNVTPRRTLGDVLASLKGERCEDCSYGIKLKRARVTDHEFESSLTAEEVRTNRDAKMNHPVYNGMSFPEPLDRPARTITATCTRVSRESLVVRHGTRYYRRLTLRERASAQGFPITFKFFAPTYTSKLKMIGNAVPPLFSFYLGCALQRIPAEELVHPWENKSLPTYAARAPIPTPPHGRRVLYPSRRRFRAAIPSLRFKSGIRFEVVNDFVNDDPHWRVEFRYGSPSDMRALRLNGAVTAVLDGCGPLLDALKVVRKKADAPFSLIEGTCGKRLQDVWTRRADGTHPHKVVDELGTLAQAVQGQLLQYPTEEIFETVETLLNSSGEERSGLANENKLRQHCLAIAAGITIGCWFNGSIGATGGDSA